MSLYDRIKPHLDKTDAEIAAIPGLMDEPKDIKVSTLNGYAQSSGLKLRLMKASANMQIPEQLRDAAFSAYDALNSQYEKILLAGNDAESTKNRLQFTALYSALRQAGIVTDEEQAVMKSLSGLFSANPTEAEVAAARAEGVAREAKESLNAWLVGKYNAAVTLIDEGKTQDEVKAFLVA